MRADRKPRNSTATNRCPTRVELRTSNGGTVNATVRFGFFPFALLIASAVWAQDYPNKTVRMIVPFAPGGATDVLARIVSQKLYERWGQIVIADNRVGASGNIGADAVIRDHYLAPPLIQLLADDAGQHVGRAARRKRHYHPDRLAGVILGPRRTRAEQRH